MQQKGTILKYVLAAGIFVGGLDIIAAFVDAWFSFHSTPTRVLAGIATAVTGNSSFTGEVGMIMLGLVIHFFIAVIYTFFFYFIYSFIKRFLKAGIIIGIAYGLFIWASMRFIVLPLLSHAQFKPFNIAKAFKPMLILIAAIGLPLAWMIPKIIFCQAKEKLVIS
jgi:uncharacterized membrane protein YagU involved in acid resistance